MKKLLYYPSFEIKTDEFLKFALLFMDEVYSIIPRSGDRYLSDTYKLIYDGTHLLKPYRPEIEIEKSHLATLDAIDRVEDMLKKPQFYSGIMGDQSYINKWKTPANQKYTIFREKYNEAWERFCIQNGIGRLSNEYVGIQVEKTLGFIYMSLLANIVSDAKGISPITDYDNLFNISLLVRACNKKVQDKINVAKATIKFKVPKNLRDISISKLIEFRNRPGFIERLHAFHEELDNYFNDLEQGKAKKGFLDSRESIFQQFSDEIVKIGVGVIPFSLGLAFLLNSNITDPLPYAKEISAGVVLTVGSVIGLRNTWKNSKVKRYSRKYLADLGKLGKK